MLRFLQVQIILHQSIIPSVSHLHLFIIPVTQAVLQELKVLLAKQRKAYTKIMELLRVPTIGLFALPQLSSRFFLPLLLSSPLRDLKVVSYSLPLKSSTFYSLLLSRKPHVAFLNPCHLLIIMDLLFKTALVLVKNLQILTTSIGT